MKKLLLLLLLLPVLIFGQTLERLPKTTTGKYNIIVIKPSAYDGVKKFPAVLFLPGIGAKGDNMTTLESEFVSQVRSAANVEGGFIIYTVQTPDTYDDEIVFARNYLIRNYQVDTNRLYLTGWSYGGGGTWYGIGNYFGLFHAAAPIATTWTVVDIARLAKAGTAIWAFHNLYDPNGGTPVAATKKYVDDVNAAGIATKAVYTLFNENSHGYGAAYDNTNPPYAPGGQGLTNPTKTLWQWFLMNSSTSRVSPPAATNNTNLTAIGAYTLKDNIVYLDGRGSVGYKLATWTTSAVPAGVNIYSVQACGWVNCSVALPKAGDYRFRLDVRDANGALSSTEITVNFGGVVVPKVIASWDAVIRILTFTDGTTEPYFNEVHGVDGSITFTTPTTTYKIQL